MILLFPLQELIDQLSGEESKELLKEMSKEIPSVVLDVSEILTRRNEEPDPPTPPQPDGEVPNWCVCNHCVPVNSVIERVCYEMRPDLCLSLRPVSLSFSILI